MAALVSGQTRKRKKVVLTLQNKLSILDRIAKGENSKEFGVGNSTVTDLKKESRIRSFVTTMESLSVSLKECKIIRLTKDEQVDEALYTWYIQKRSQEIPVTGPILTEKAQLFH